MSIVTNTQLPAIPASAWQPQQLGLARALAIASVLVAGMVYAAVLLAGRSERPAPLPPPPVEIVTLLAEPPPASPLPPSAAPEPPQSEPRASEPPAAATQPAPADPVAAIAPPEMQTEALAPAVAVPSSVAVPSPVFATEPAKPEHPVEPRWLRAASPHRRVKPVPAATPAAPTPAAPTQSVALAPQTTLPPVLRAPPVPAAPSAAPPDTTSGIGPYRTGLHSQIARNVVVTPEIEAAGTSGTVFIEAVIAPDGRVMAAHVARSSGNAAIDRAGLAAVQAGGYRPYGPHMPATPITISVPIEIGPA